ncbi:hypothetical protein COY27_04965 [Candidatus Woesearchaeota archaeon CG_4_10_14_0_2_um_filter_33_13]|nr:MAG: hypothetical protein COY27_04965 [Candidatus Woesearchaeota archaeon CG_4_10_14_0_2_um_filter_33_13]
MKLTYTTRNNRIKVEIESKAAKDAFKELAEFQEVFDEANCGLCSKDDLQFTVRTVEGNDFYELRCKSCGGKLVFGQHKSGGTLFPKRKQDDGSYKNRGWFKWKPEE